MARSAAVLAVLALALVASAQAATFKDLCGAAKTLKKLELIEVGGLPVLSSPVSEGGR